MSEEKKEATEATTFKGFELSEVKGGFKGKREIADSIFKEKGITSDVTKKVFQAVKEIHSDMLDFCAEQVPIKKSNVELTLPIASGVNLDARVKMVSHFPGIAKKDENGNIIKEAVPLTKYGSCSKGISFTFTSEEKEQISRIATDVEKACADFCSKMDKK